MSGRLFERLTHLNKEDVSEAIRLLTAGEIKKAKEFILQTVESKGPTREEWTQFLLYIGIKAGDQERGDPIQRHAFALCCFEAASDVNTAEERRAIIPDLVASAHYNLGNALSDSGDYPEAIRELREAVKMKPDNPSYHYNLGTALSGSGDYPEAIRELREAVKMKPDNPSYHNNLGIVFLSTYDYVQAKSQFDAAREMFSRIGLEKWATRSKGLSHL